MKIRDIFENQIDRHIDPVVEIGGETDKSRQAELEEFVVTRQVGEHLKAFFKYYINTSRTGKGDVGVWISGFFGSGKSHFMKMLAYLLQNEEIGGKMPIDYFENKVEDNFTLADMKAAGDIETKVILFDIDQASDADARNSQEMLVKVFNRKFNEMQGFSESMPWLADLERQMVAKGIYEQFKETYEEVSGTPWEEGRNDDFFGEDNFVETAIMVLGMSEESARNLYQNKADQYSLTVEDFAVRVREYIEAHGRNNNVVFMVDEVGQYIGNSSELILNLQSIVQCLGTECNGHAWVVVTSQQAIDTVAKNLKSNDFSKVTGRFPVRLSMSSINVDEVIKKRILLKNEAGTDKLRMLYKDKGGTIKGKVTFGGGAPTFPRFNNEEDFIDTYPFFPYQFDLLQSSYDSVRNRGSSGKSMSSGERSLLSAFQDAAVKYSDDELDRLVPFCQFYNTMESFLEQDIRVVMERASKKETLEKPLDLDILKLLFMLKDMDNDMPTNLDNLTSLMVSYVDEDKIALRGQIEKALYRLMDENLVQRDDDKYIFLTNDEQQVNIEIERMDLDPSEIIEYIGKQVFTGICDTKIRYNANFMPTYNQVIDDNPRGQQTSEITMYLYTPFVEKMEDSMMNMRVQTQNCLIVTMADNKLITEEIERMLKLEKFIRLKSRREKSDSDSRERVISLKRDEYSRKSDCVASMISDAILNADYYTKTGRLTGLKGVQAKDRVNEAFRVLIDSVYTKLTYIKNPVQKSTDLSSRLDTSNHQMSLDDSTNNKLAKEEVLKFLQRKNEQKMPVTMRSIIEQFQKIPFGWNELDIAGIVAELFVAEDIVLQLSNKNIAISDTQIVNYLTKRDYKESLKIKIKEKTSDELIESVKEVLKTTFTRSVEYTTDSKLAEEINKVLNDALDMLYIINKRYPQDGKYQSFGFVFKQDADRARQVLMMYPGYKKVQVWISTFRGLQKIYEPKALFESFVSEATQFKNYKEEIGSISDFFKNQLTIFEKSCEFVDLYENNKSYLEETSAKGLMMEMLQVINMEEPYREIYKLSEDNKKFGMVLGDVLAKEAEPVVAQIEDDRKTARASFEAYNIEVPTELEVTFKTLLEKVETCQFISTIIGVREESARIRDNYIDQAVKKYNEMVEVAKRDQKEKNNGEDDNPSVVTPSVPPTKKLKSVVVGNLLGSNRKLETKEDVDTVVEIIRKQLMDMLDDETILNLK